MINILEIITGHTGVDHVTSFDDASLYRSIFGAEDVVLNVGSQFEHTIISNNLIKIADGDLVIQGHQARIRTNDYEELVIDNGTPGMQRHDLIVARYEKDVVSGIESVQLAVVKGVAGATAVDPELTQDDITSSGTIREFPLYRVQLNGINVETTEKLFEVVNQDLKDLQIESGSNDDGNWVQLPDKTLIVHKRLTNGTIGSDKYNDLYRSFVSGSFPKEFSVSPIAMMTGVVSIGGSSKLATFHPNAISTTGYTFMVFSNEPFSSLTTTLSYLFAIGKGV